MIWILGLYVHYYGEKFELDWLLLFAEMYMVICSGIQTLQNTNMAHSHLINITDVMWNYYILPQVPR